MSGSEATRFRNSVIAAAEFDQPLVHVDVDDLRPVLHLVARDVERGGIVARGDELAEARRAGDVGALADVDEGDLGREREGLEPGKPHQRRLLRHQPRRMLRHRRRDRPDMVGRGPAAAADDVDQALAREFLDLPRHELRALVVLPELVRQPGVRIGAGEGVGDVRDLGEMRAHRVGPERAVEADGEGPRMAHRVPEGGRRLPRQRPPREVGDRARDHHRQVDAPLGEDLLAGEDRRLGVQRVEDRLDQDQVGAAVDQPADLLAIGEPQVVERHRAIAGVVDVRRDRRRPVRRPEGAGDEAPLAVLGGGPVAGAAGDLGAGLVQRMDLRLHRVVGLGDRRRREGVGLDDVGAGDGIAVVDVLDRLRLGQDQQVVVALLRMPVRGAGAMPGEVVLAEAEPLDLGAHRAVEDQDALARRGFERGPHLASVALACHRASPSCRPEAHIGGSSRRGQRRGPLLSPRRALLNRRGRGKR